MRNVFVLFTLLFLILPSFASAQSAVQDCSTPTLPFCEQIFFEGEANNGNPSLILIQRLELDARPRETVSDDFILSYLGGFNDQELLFDLIGDGTEEIVSEGYLLLVDNVRVIAGTSDVLERDQPSLMVVITHNDVTFVSFVFGQVYGYLDYIEHVALEDDIEIEMEGFTPIEIEDSGTQTI